MIRLNWCLPGIIAGACAFLSCSNLVGSGGGSDVGNGVVVGSLQQSDGTPAAHTVVTLVPFFYNPATDGQCMYDTTDEQGTFQFTLTTNGTYNIEAKNLNNGAKALYTEIVIRLHDTLRLPRRTLSEPGTITVFLPDSIDTATGYLYIQGTTLWVPLSDAQRLSEGGFIATLDSVPATTLTAVHYVHQGATVQSVQISDTINVEPNTVSVIEAFVYWQHYTCTTSPLPCNTIIDIEVLPNGTQWIATAGGGVARITGLEWTLFSAENSPLPSNDITDIAFENNMTVWIATSRGVASFGAEQWKVYTTENSGLPSNMVTDIQIDRSGIRWFGTKNAGLAKFDGFSWNVFDTATSLLPSNCINQIAMENAPQLPGGSTLWIATDRGIACVRRDSLAVFSTQNSGMYSDQVNCIKVDHFGNKWCGHANGISRLSDNEWTVFTSLDIPELTGAVTSIAEDMRGTLWFGTLAGALRYDGVSWLKCAGKRYMLLDNASVQCITIDALDNKWIGTANYGMIVFGPDIHSGEPRKRR